MKKCKINPESSRNKYISSTERHQFTTKSLTPIDTISDLWSDRENAKYTQKMKEKTEPKDKNTHKSKIT